MAKRPNIRRVAKPKRFADVLRNAIVDSDMSWYRISQNAECSEQLISRFMRGEGMPTLTKCEDLARAIGLRMVLAPLEGKQ